jgi:hypothetical protein
MTVMQLSEQAFLKLPEEYGMQVVQQAVKRICHGCVEKEADQVVVIP